MIPKVAAIGIASPLCMYGSIPIAASCSGKSRKVMMETLSPVTASIEKLYSALFTILVAADVDPSSAGWIMFPVFSSLPLNLRLCRANLGGFFGRKHVCAFYIILVWFFINLKRRLLVAFGRYGL